MGHSQRVAEESVVKEQWKEQWKEGGRANKSHEGRWSIHSVTPSEPEDSRGEHSYSNLPGCHHSKGGLPDGSCSLWVTEQVRVGQTADLEEIWKIFRTLFQVQIIILFYLMTLHFWGSEEFIRAIFKFWHYKYAPWYLQHMCHINISYSYILLHCLSSLNISEGQRFFCSVLLLFVI